MEYKQLAESVISIKEKENYFQQNSREDKEYELMFDEALNVPPMWLDNENVKLLARYRDDILVTSLYDSALASAKQLTSHNGQAINPKLAISPKKAVVSRH